MRHIIHRKLEEINRYVRNGEGRDNAFLTGNLGLVYYYFHLYIVTEEHHYLRSGEVLLEKIFSELNSPDPHMVGASLCSGGAGLGYVVNRLAGAGLVDFDVDSGFEELDHYLYQTALTQLSVDEIDLLHGALGTLHYFASRQQTPAINEYLNTLVDQLCQRAVARGEGIWFRNNMVRVKRSDSINLSLSHGLCGVLLVLMETYPHCRQKEAIRRVIERGIYFMLKHQLPVDFEKDLYSVFPFYFNKADSEFSVPNRMGWCYGDLGQVLMLYRAARLFGNAQYLEVADLVGTQSTLRKSPDATMIRDAHFCHGAAGVAQLYHAIYTSSKNSSYFDAWQYWVEQTIILLDDGIKAGLYINKEQNLLEGLPGIGLTLLTSLSHKELCWSKALLL